MAHLEIIRPAQLSRWERFKRSITLGPWNPKDREIARYFGGTPVNAGVSVNEETVMSYSAVWAAVNLVSAHISSVPLVLYKNLPDGGKERFSGHPLYRLVHDRPNPLMGSAVFRRTVQSNKMVWGNGYAEIERDFAGRPVALWPLLSYQMAPFFEGGRLLYRYRNPGGTDVIFEPSDVIHLRGYSETGIEGSSAVSKGRESFGLAIAAERFGGAFFGNGSTMDGIITYPPGINMTPQAKEDNRKALSNRHQGVDRAYRMLALYEGAKYERLGVPPNEAQFLETRMFQIEEVARWFNIPPHKLKHLQRTSYNSIEHQSIEYVTDALDPDWVLWEQELNLKLVSPLEMNQQRIEHIREGMLRGDSAARSQLQSSQFSIASVTPNEVRQMENRNPIAGGDQSFVALNLIPMDLARPYWEAQIEKAKQPPPEPFGGKEKQADPERDERERLLRAALQSAEDARDVAMDNARRADEARELLAVAKQQNEERHAREIAQLGDALAEANTSLHTAASREQALVEERDTALEVAAGSGRDTAQAMQQAAAAEVERDAAKAALAMVRSSLENADKAAADLLTERDAALALAEEAAKERDAERTEAARLREVYAGARSAVEELHSRLDATTANEKALTTERDTLQAEAETLRADLARARADIATELDARKAEREALEAERDEVKAASQQTAVELAAVKVTLEHAQRDLAIVKQENTGAVLAMEMEQRQQAAQRSALLASMRSLFVDASERLLQKESDRARKHQATPEKLRAWVETFYPMHVETVRGAFRPLVGAWSAITGGDSEALLGRLTSEHIEASRQAFARVLDAEDDDERAALLERTLRRWEDERAEAMADALVREGMAGHG
jgi:HK97 family phage portal protein